MVVTGRLLAESGRHPWGRESSTWREWLYPALLAVVSPLPLIAAVSGQWGWLPALGTSFVLGVVAMWMLGRLARRYDKRALDSRVS
jgi:hypothetical protein